jgi:hypothetical protein
MPSIVNNLGLVCCDCGYDLTGLSDQGRCPECSTSIQVSIRHAESAREADPRKAPLPRGLQLMMAVYVVGWLVCPLLLSTRELSRAYRPSRVWDTAFACVLAVMFFLGMVIMIRLVDRRPLLALAMLGSAMVLACFCGLFTLV